jgi:hypothetical protein
MSYTISQILRTRLTTVCGDPSAASELQSILQGQPSDIKTVAMPTSAAIGAKVSGKAASVTISNTAGSANVSSVTFQFKDGDGNNLTAPTVVDLWLSDASTGLGLTATTASGGVVAGASGVVIGILTAAKAFRAVTDATGKAILTITDTSKTTFYPVASVPGGSVTVGAQLTSGSYG